jgi:hypothetical protein
MLNWVLLAWWAMARGCWRMWAKDSASIRPQKRRVDSSYNGAPRDT